MKKSIIIAIFVFALCLSLCGCGLYEKSPTEVEHDILEQMDEYTLYADISEDFVPPCIVVPATVTRLSDDVVISLDTPNMAVSKELSDFFCSLEYSEKFCKCMPEYYFENGYGAFSFNLSQKYVRNETGQRSLSEEQVNRIKTLIGQ